MPKILVKETDLTSPGTAGRYENYSVLIAGTWGHVYTKTGEGDNITITTTPGTKSLADRIAEIKATAAETKSDVVLPINTPKAGKNIAPDTNGVYEFTSADDFLATIGQASPEIELNDTIVYHYGNQMAYELLKMGYTVIYAPFKVEEVDNLKTADFWSVFKDKASYDFRFVTHGLLRSNVDTSDVTVLNKTLGELEDAEDALRDIFAEQITTLGITAETATYEYLLEQSAYPQLELEADASLATNCNSAYAAIYTSTDYPGFIVENSTSGDRYSNFLDAVLGVEAAKTRVTAEISKCATRGVIGTNLINSANEQILSLATYIVEDPSKEDHSKLPGRGDCVALLELDERVYLDSDSTDAPEIRIIKAINDLTISKDNGKFGAITVPSVEYQMTPADYYNGNTHFPAAFHYLSCFRNSLAGGFAEWYAAAGYTRGVSSQTVATTSLKLGEAAIGALEPRYNMGGGKTEPKCACNVIAYFRGSYYLWGNRTAHPLGTFANNDDLVASSFLNIRQLCTTIKKQLYVACRKFTFDPNSDTLWVNFVNAIRPTLELMKADQGIRDFRVLKVFTDKKATLKAKIRIIPIEAVEDFDLEISLEDSFGETTAVATE